MTAPKVSIIIPVYNGQNYLKDAIQSALDQDYPNKEILVVNDGSSDATSEVAKSFGARIRYFEKENGGVATALNLGIESMSGEYFSWLSHDDLYKTNKLSLQVDRLLKERNPESVIVYSNCEGFDVVANKTIFKSDLKAFEPNSARFSIAISNNIHGCSLLIPRVAFKMAGLFNPDLAYTQDYEMWFRLAKYCRFVLLEDCLVISRIHPSQTSRTSRFRRCWENDRVVLRLLKQAVEENRALNPDRVGWRELQKVFWRRRMPSSSVYAFWRSITN